MKLILILFLLVTTVGKNLGDAASCDCDYHSGGCIISEVI